MKVRDVLVLLRSDGWYLVATEGSHRQFNHSRKRASYGCGKTKRRSPAWHVNSILKRAGLKK